MTSNLRHLGLIMDGNRRWAMSKGLQTLDGHKAGYQSLKELLRTIKELNIEYLSVYAFSTENWNRTKEEIDGLIGLIRWVLKNEVEDLVNEELRILFVGSEDNVPADILRMIHDVEERTKDFTNGTLAICFNYGGQQEIVDSVKLLTEHGDPITIDSITQNLYQPEIPPVDLIIRTSGEMRISNFMIWRAVYSEFYFSPTLWPEFNGEELKEIVSQYNARNRRFGT